MIIFIRNSILIFFVNITLTVSAKTYYVAPTGSSDNNPGTITQPWATWQKAFNTANAGDTVFFRGGVYYSLVRNNIDPRNNQGNNGTKKNPIVYMSYPGEWAILDCKRHEETYGFGNNVYNGAIAIVDAEHLYFKDFEVRNVFQLDSVISGGISASGSRNLTFEHIIMHDIGQRGFYIAGGAWLSHYEDGDTQSYPRWPDEIDTTRFINCDVYNLCDSLSVTGSGWNPGNGADGWKTIHYRGNHIEWRGCRAWNYTDDGIDPSLINGGTAIIDNCWLMAGSDYAVFNYNGLVRNNEQNGVKLNGRPISGVANNSDGGLVTNSLAIFSRGTGFGVMNQEDERGNHKFYNNTAYQNGYGFSSDNQSTEIYPANYVYRNNISYNALNVTATAENYIVAIRGEEGAEIMESHNNWDYSNGYPGFVLSDTVAVTDADFVTVDFNILISLFTAPRQTDGSLPVQRPMMLASTSDLIDAGVNVGLPYYGSSPDIGYSEYASGIIVQVPPVFLRATVENATPSRLEMSYNLSLANIKPATSAFSVKVNSVTRTVSSVAISGTKVLLTLASPIVYGETVTLTYTKPSSNPIQSVQGEQAVSITNKPVINNCNQVPNSSPIVSISSPTNGTSFIAPANITIAVTASDSDGTISRVEFFSGSTKLGERTSIPYTFTWNGVSEGSYSITAVATDNLNAKTVSTAVTLIVEKPGTIINQLPEIMIISPEKESENKKNDNITFEIHATDPDGTISHVELRNGNTTLAEFTAPPYIFVWHGVDTGTYYINAIATDNLGATSVSQMIEVIVGFDYKTMSDMINLYPNPSDGRFTLEMDPILTEQQVNRITIVNLSGKTIHKEIIAGLESTKSFDLSGIEIGTYIILITNDKAIVATKKFIKQ